MVRFFETTLGYMSMRRALAVGVGVGEKKYDRRDWWAGEDLWP